MKSTVAMLLCALSFGLGGCGNSADRVDMVAEGDTNFTVYCATMSACRQKATDRCQEQGYPHFDIVETLKGDDLGEGKGVAIQCRF
jgi:hypothetical protein